MTFRNSDYATVFVFVLVCCSCSHLELFEVRFASLDVVTAAAAVENTSKVKIKMLFKYLHFLMML